MIFLWFSQGWFRRAKGNRVLFPAPGGAVRIRVLV